MVSGAELETIVEASDALTEETVTFLQEMVSTPSPNPPGEYEAMYDLVRETFQDLGWAVETRWAPDALLEELSIPTDYPRPNILATVASGTGPTIALNAHLDTVPVDDPTAWDYDPFGATIVDGSLFGRGATDAKGRIAAYTLAARVLEETGFLPEGTTLVLAITADEETGGEAGAAHLLEATPLSPDVAIVEGTGQEIWYATTGARQYRVTVSGVAAHAGSHLDDGANALVGASRLVNAVAEYGDELATESSELPGMGGPTCTPTTIEGGVKTNVVPANCQFTVDQRVPPDFDDEALESEFSELIEGVPLPPGTEAHVEVLLRAKACQSDPADVHIRALHENAEHLFDHEVPLVGHRGFTDARFFAAHGAKTVNFGPGDDESNVHSANERVSVQQVIDVSAIIAASVADIARHEGSDHP